MPRTRRARPFPLRWTLLLALVAWAALRGSAQAQELEPRAYSSSPVGTNFALAGYSWSGGGVLVDASLPVSDIESRIDSVFAGYSRTFAVGDRSASVALTLPWFSSTTSGNVFESRRSVDRTGFGDLRFRLACNLIGGPALSPAEFARAPQRTTLGFSLNVVAPTGQYDPARLVNLGANRWAFRPDFGVSIPLGRWFFEASAGVWLFTDNDEFFGETTREQDPLTLIQFHGGYQFKPGFWVAADANYYRGGATTVDGVAKRDLQANSRYGLTFSFRLTPNVSAKLAAATGLTTRFGSDYDTVLLAIQYLWFDRSRRPTAPASPAASPSPAGAASPR